MMCGIAGYVQRQPVSDSDLDVLRRQLAVLAHRGPDSEGVIALGPAALGQRRLRIIDLVTGDPPITNEDRTVAVTFNGEIYNFEALRRQLSRSGHRLSTRGDTEVIAHLAEELSPIELARTLDGMFAFAVWDDKRRRLVLARDRFGKKPLYWCHRGGLLVFASEIKGVLAHPNVPSALNDHVILPYLTFGYAPTPETFFAGISTLPPGHVLTLSAGSEPEVAEYWRPPLPLPAQRATQREAARETRRLLTDAVKRRLVADVPVGAFLSGGIDSSIIVATMAKESSAPVRTFTVGFEDSHGFDERPYARLIARRYDTDHTEVVVRPKAVDLVEKLVWLHDQPFGDSSAIPTYLLSEFTRGHVTVALSGDGGDELFAGYERFIAGLLFARYLALPRQVRNAVALAADRLPRSSRRSRIESVRRLLATGGGDIVETFASWVSYLPQSVRSELADRRWEGAVEPLAGYRSVWAGSSGQRLLVRLLDLNARTYLVDDLLVKMDRMSMAHGLEVRSPFLDQQLAEYVLRLPGSLKVRRLQLKHLLKQAYAAELPSSIRSRRKQGFALPLDRWMREDLWAYARDVLGPSARVRQWLNGEAIDRLMAVHHAGSRNYGHGIWALLTLELFLRREGW